MPYSICAKPHVQMISQVTRPMGRIHHWNPMPVSSLTAIATPPISAESSSRSIAISAPSGMAWNEMPNRSRTAAATGRLLTPASRPDISTSIASVKPAAATAQSSWNPNSEPACADVEIEPTSTKPPILVTMPRIRSTMTLTACPAA